MRLVVKRGDNHINELRFTRGPIYIGRQIGSQIFLPDRAVSRQHAVLYNAKDGSWVAEDLDSANKTLVNNEAVHKAAIRDGDVIKIADFSIQVAIESDKPEEKPINLDDTMTHVPGQHQTIIRRVDTEDSTVLRMPPRRVKDFSALVYELSKTSTLDHLAMELSELLLRQFAAYHVWLAMRRDAAGAMTAHAGKKRTTEKLQFNDLLLKDAVTRALERFEYTLIPRIIRQQEGENLRSAVIAPVMIDNTCRGVLYVANSVEREHYTTSDIDYLIFVSLYVGSLIINY
jgi:pSer/pThr/pTyr-binding forkhead associated (FHA) protein